MKKKKLYLTAFLLVLALALQGGIFSGLSVPVQAAATSKKQTGFVKKNGSWYYYDKNGKKATGWYKSAAGNQYYFGKTGAAKAGILTISGKKYCFNEKGKKLISQIVKHNKRAQIVTSVKKYMDESKNKALKEMLETDIFATNVYTLGYESDSWSNLDYTNKIITM